jgi:hypothetical protein
MSAQWGLSLSGYRGVCRMHSVLTCYLNSSTVPVGTMDRSLAFSIP